MSYYQKLEGLGYVIKVEKNKFLLAIYSREHKGINSIILILGARGIGKTYLAMKIAETLSEKMHNLSFTADDVVFDLAEILARIKYHEDNKEKWAWIIFDEAGLEVAARDFMQDINKIMSYVMQSFRHTKINLVICLPHPDMVDLHVRNMADFWIDMKGRGKARVYKTKLITFRSGVKTPLFCTIENASLASEALCIAYEEKRKAYLDKKYAEYLAETQRRKESMERLVANTAEHQREVLEIIKKEYKDGKIPVKRLAYEIKQRLGISQAPAYDLRIKLLEEIAKEKASTSTQQS
jgi:hypothetical protein